MSALALELRPRFVRLLDVGVRGDRQRQVLALEVLDDEGNARELALIACDRQLACVAQLASDLARHLQPQAHVLEVLFVTPFLEVQALILQDFLNQIELVQGDPAARVIHLELVVLPHTVHREVDLPAVVSELDGVAHQVH